MKSKWQTKKIADICEIGPKKGVIRERLKPDELVSFVPMRDLSSHAKYLDPKEERRFGDVYKNYTYFADGDVLLAKITPCFENGKLGIARDLVRGIGFGSSEYIVLRTRSQVIPEYLYYFLSREEFRNEGKVHMQGAVGHKRLSLDFLNQVTISFPSIDEQKRIVKKMDDIFVKTAKAKENVEGNAVKSVDLFDSLLNKIFNEPTPGWSTCALREHVKFIDYRGRTPQKMESGLRLITAKNIKKGYLQKEPEEFVDPTIYDKWMIRGIPKQGDVLFTTEAPLAMVAQLDTEDRVVFAQRIIVLQPDRKLINPTFLKYLLLSNPIRKKIFDKATGATVTGIKARLLKEIEIIFPDITQQNEIVSLLNEAYRYTRILNEKYLLKAKKVADLESVILKQALSSPL